MCVFDMMKWLIPACIDVTRAQMQVVNVQNHEVAILGLTATIAQMSLLLDFMRSGMFYYRLTYVGISSGCG